MRFSCSTKQLLKGVLLISNICQAKSTKQILQDVKIIVDQKEIQLLGTDLEIALRYVIEDSNIVEPGIVALPAVKLLNMLRELADGDVEFTIDKRTCSIVAKDTEFKLISDDPEEFPIIPNYDFTEAMELNANSFVNFATKTIFAVAKDMSCYAYNGVLVELYEDGVKLIATDGRRLAIAGNIDRDRENILSASVVPVKGIIQILKSLDEVQDTILLKLYKNQFIMKTKNVEIASRLLEGEFPKYHEVIPKNHDLIIKIEREKLNLALRKAAITAGNEVRSVQFIFKPGALILFSQQEGIGESKSEIPVDYNGKKIEITFNPDYIMEYLKVTESEILPFCFKDEDSSCVIEDNEREFYIVMPITSK